jgi:hypothetical protein
MEERTSHKLRLIKTPVHNIPIGEPVKTPDGHYGLRIKRPKGNEYEEMSLDTLIFMVVTLADTQSCTQQVPHNEGAAIQ